MNNHIIQFNIIKLLLSQGQKIWHNLGFASILEPSEEPSGKAARAVQHGEQAQVTKATSHALARF